MVAYVGNMLFPPKTEVVNWKGCPKKDTTIDVCVSKRRCKTALVLLFQRPVGLPTDRCKSELRGDDFLPTARRSSTTSMVHLRAPVRWGGIGRGCWMLREEPIRCVSLLSCDRSTPFQRRGLTCRSFRPRPALLRLRVVEEFEMIHRCIAGRVLWYIRKISSH